MPIPSSLRSSGSSAVSWASDKHSLIVSLSIVQMKNGTKKTGGLVFPFDFVSSLYYNVTMRILLFLIFVLVCVFVPKKPAIASDVLELTNRVTIEGKILNPAESPRKTWQVEMAKGVIVEMPHKTTVDKQITRSQAIDQYYAKVPFLPESVEIHLKSAEVCKSQGLEELSHLHYERVLDIDPENQTARSALNQRKVDGEWTTLEAQMARQGYIKDKRGNWVTRQQQLISEQQLQLGQRPPQSHPGGIVQNPDIRQPVQIRITDFDARRGGRD